MSSSNVVPLHPKPTYAELEQEVARMRDVLTAVEAARWFDRFTCLDGINNDSCPACGGPIVVEIVEKGDNGGRVHGEPNRGRPPGVHIRAARL